jgi:hypothetical protein
MYSALGAGDWFAGGFAQDLIHYDRNAWLKHGDRGSKKNIATTLTTTAKVDTPTASRVEVLEIDHESSGSQGIPLSADVHRHNSPKY